MARRSLGVVLIVALVSWTVNWLTFGCQSQHSRAAVVVPAGASPAYQPEPSRSRHACCPQVLRFSSTRYSGRLLLPPSIAKRPASSSHYRSGVRPRLAARPPTATLRTARAAVIRTLSSLWPTAAKAKTPNSAPKMAKTAAPDPTANPAATRTSHQPAPRTSAPTPAAPPRIIPAATANPTPDP